MNKQHFRVIFSKTLQRLIVVSELAKSCDKSSSSSSVCSVSSQSAVGFSSVLAPLKPLCFSLFCALGFVSFSSFFSSAFADTLIIQADKSAPKTQQPIVLQTANGLPQVNIQTPNAKGLSHNKYSQFDVAEKGAILNNSRTGTSTQLAGQVTANPYLARGEAKVILNEVNASSPSVMKGYVEVAGGKADVIIANPSGLHCEGCGVINSGRVTLSTGKPEIKNGEVANFKVASGKVVVSGRGLDNSRVDYTEILAREVEVNAGIWSGKKATVITGKNTIKRTETNKTSSDENHLQIIHSTQAVSGESQPQFALDVAELGGMYSGKIHLIGTEKGVGVRNAGHIGASSSDVMIDVNGKVLNKNSIQAQQSVNIQAKGAIENTKPAKILAHQADIKINTDKSIEQSGIIGAKKGLSLYSQSLNQTQSGEIQGGNVQLQVADDVINRGLISAKQDDNETATALIKAKQINNVGTGRIYGDLVALQADSLLNHDEQSDTISSAIIAARKRLDLGVKQLTNQNHYYSGNTKNATALFSGGELHIGGKLNAQNQAEGQADMIDNRSALIESLGKMNLSAAFIHNMNDFFATELQTVSERDVNWHYVVPQGIAESELRFDRRLLSRWSQSRGRNGFQVRSKPQFIYKPENGDVKSNYLPEANQCIGTAVPNCELSVHSYYFPSDPAWAHFTIKPTIRENVAKLLNEAKVPIEPVAPIKPQAPTNGNAAAQQAYEKSLEEYHAYKAVYDAAYQAYLADKAEFDAKVLPAYQQFVKDNQDAFSQLSVAIIEHNQKFAILAGNRYRDYWVKTADKEIIKEDVVVKSQAAEILSGGDLTIDTERLLNDKSRILSGGDVTLNGNLDMQQAQGRQITETYGSQYYSFLKQRKSRTASTRHKYKRVNEKHYSGLLSNPQKAIVLPVAQVFEQYDFDENSLVVKPAGENLVLPSSALYKLNPAADSHVLIESDPAFTDYRKWLSSDYMYNALRYEPNNVHKRLGDGYYEQRLVREQLHRLTGRLFSGNEADFEQQYKTLMDNGVTVAQKFNLTPGIALSQAQVAALTSDIVWFENQTVTLPNGTQQTVLVPKIYIQHLNKADLQPKGSLLSGENVQINSQEIQNHGTILGRKVAVLNTKELDNRGTISGERVAVQSRGDVLNQGSIEADKALFLNVQGDLTQQSTTQTSSITANHYHRKSTTLDRKALLHVKGDDGILYVNAQNLHSIGADIRHNGKGDILLDIKKDINLTALQTEVDEKWGNDDHYRTEKVKDIEVSHIQGKGNISLQGHNLVTEAAVIETDKKLTALLENDAVLKSTAKGLDFEEYHYVKTNAGTSKKTQTTLDKKRTQTHQGSTLSANAIAIQAGNKLAIEGSDVVSEQNLALSGKEVVVQAALDKTYQEHFSKTTKSGLSGTGGIGFSIGSQKTTTEADNTRYTAQASQVGSLKGDVNIQAQDYKQAGSYVSALEKDVNIQAEKVEIGAAQQAYDSHFKQTTEQKGLTIAITAPAISAIQAAQKTISSMNTVGASRNNRVNAMATANAAWDGLRAAESIKSGIDATQALFNGDMQNAGVGVSITYSQQKSEQTQTTEGSTAATSKVNAGGKVNINAEGGEKSHLHINGADISGKQGTHLASSGDVILSATEQTHQERSQNKSSGFNAGVAITYGAKGFAMGVTAGGNYGKGYGNGDDVTYAYSHIGDKQSQTTITSGKTTALLGTQVYGNHVKIDTTDLTIRSLQETATYKGKQKQVSGQLTVGAGAAVAGSYNQSKVNSDYASVTEQSGIYAGDGGYQVNVQKHTEMTGGIMTSTEKAEAENRNRIETGTLSARDVQNHANYSGSGFGLSGSVAMNFDTPLGKYGQAQSNKQAVNEKGEKLYEGQDGKETTQATSGGKNNPIKLAEGLDSLTGTASFGFGSEKDSQRSETKSGINTANIVIKDEQGQLEKTGKSAEQVKSEIKTEVTTETAENHSGKLENRFDKDKILKELNIQVKVTQEFRKNAFATIDAYVLPKQEELREKIKVAKTEAEKDELYKEIYKLQYQKRLLETVVGIVAGTPELAITQGTLQLAATKMREETLKNSRLFKGIKDEKTGRVLRNDSYSSGYFDGVKLAGVRLDLDVICGTKNERCESSSDGGVIYKGDDKLKTLQDALNPEKNEKASKLYGPTGGAQYLQGGWYLGNVVIPYKPHSLSENLMESFAGTHDPMGGQIWGWYDNLGNTLRGKNQPQTMATEATTIIALPFAAPFALSDLMSSDFTEILFKLGGN